MVGIEDRLTALEIDNEKKKKEENQKRKRIEEEMTGEKPKEMNYARILGGQPAGRNGSQDKPVVEEVKFKSTWAKQLSQANLEQQLKMATEAAKKREEEGEEIFKTKMNKSKTPAKQNKLGNSLERHDEKDWAWGENDEQWDGIADRQAKNQEKKRREEEKKNIRIEKAAYIGRCRIGIGPIRQESIDYFNKITSDYNLAKKMAAAEFLQGYLKFDDEDLSDIAITDTKMSGKGDHIMYIVLDCPEKVLNIRRRLADCQNVEVKTREFIPPQFYARYTALAKYASELRARKSNLKTQIRFLQMDIGLFTKTKGSMLPFLPVNMEELEADCKLPAIEPNAEWNRRVDQPPWRRTSPSSKKVTLKSLAGHNTDAVRLEDRDKDAASTDSIKSKQPRQKKLKGSSSVKVDSSTEGSSSSSSSDD